MCLEEKIPENSIALTGPEKEEQTLSIPGIWGDAEEQPSLEWTFRAGCRAPSCKGHWEKLSHKSPFQRKTDTSCGSLHAEALEILSPE